MKENLPQIKKERIIDKIRNFFNRLFRKEEFVVEDRGYLTTNNDSSQLDTIKAEEFKNNIKTESSDRIIILQRKLKDGQIEIADLTDEELEKMINLFKKQINEKRSCLYG